MLALTRGFHNVTFRSNSLQIISALRDIVTNMSSIGHIIEDSKAMLQRIPKLCNAGKCYFPVLGLTFCPHFVLSFCYEMQYTTVFINKK